MSYLKANARVFRNEAGVALRMTGVNIDITERKRAELELLSTSSLLRTVLDSASDVAIIATDPGYGITVFNAGHTVTFPLWVFGVSRLGIPPEVNALGTILLVIAFGFIGIQYWSQRRSMVAKPVEATT